MTSTYYERKLGLGALYVLYLWLTILPGACGCFWPYLTVQLPDFVHKGCMHSHTSPGDAIRRPITRFWNICCCVLSPPGMS